ncbi:sulfonate ABC transporter substrate-binding protein [Roseateles terrae]|uniref:Sulfonate transport system substrate-binding protein n=1 Tax=Roseateles terrae TaxID=431060 RepID=A0ABR6GNG8_9BURK|nr:sulfonate ABC transporter substrate-binding protein [Roseateles terrae]MBB3193655.1 sulfonate transport system substrate-binding protein [Roseateles terrae]OWQ89185.1 sulfonate ABC transporter substrate-binding protein [Roseateles terrae]
MPNPLFHRRRILRFAAACATVVTATLVLAGSASHAAAQTPAPHELRIGFQKYGTLTVLKAKGDLEKRLAPLGITVKWTEFPAGPQLLEGLNVGAIDFGTVGEAPPIFAQAAGADLVYVAHQPPAPSAEALIVPKGSAVRSLADLRGKKVALNKGSNVHYLLVKLLEKEGLKYSDLQVVYLPPADARAAFESGAVDAWVIWDPFLASAQRQLGARVVADGTGVVNNLQFYLAARPYADRNPQVVAAIVDELARLDRWSASNLPAVVSVLAPQIGLDAATTELAASRFSYGIQPITPAVAAQQQQIADAFHQLKLIPRSIRISDALPRALKTAAH